MDAHITNSGTERKKPGRKAETPAQKLQRLEQEMVAARRAVAEAEQRKLSTIGQAVMAEAEAKPAFMRQLRTILKDHVTTKTGKEALASLLDAAASDDTPAPLEKSPAIVDDAAKG